MSNFQEQSLDEDAVILPVTESCPEFLHCEKERRAVESLLSAGPEAFYSAVGTERRSCFLSPQEVGHMASWAQDVQQVQHQENGVEGSSEMDDFHSAYFPCHTDRPAPSLELGWPERSPWVGNNSITVHSSPPAEGEPPLRQIIRWHLQKAELMIAIVTDSLTDGPVIEDLHTAASRGVRVYIILNQRSVQEFFTLDKLKHPNMRVRVLGGKTFRSSTGKAVVGEMKQKFLLVDSVTVIHGSYSLTWTDAHLHRQLVTILHGPVVDSFDREFRILYAASVPASDVRTAADAHIEGTDPLTDVSELLVKQQLSLEPQISNPPSPPGDSFLDWEAMGVVQLFPVDTEQMPELDDLLFDTNIPITDGSAENGNQYLDMKRGLNDSHSSPGHSPTDPAISGTTERWHKTLDRAISRELTKERGTDLNHRTTTRVDGRAAEQTQTPDKFSSSKRSESCRRDSIKEEESDMEGTTSRAETTASRKPLILRVPVSDSFSSCSNIMRRIRTCSPGLFGTAPKSDVAKMSRSMMDLSALNTEVNHDEKEGPLSSFNAAGFNSGPATPASVLMQNRNNVKKTVQQRTPKTCLSTTRPRSSTFSVGMNHTKSLIKEEGDHGNT